MNEKTDDSGKGTHREITGQFVYKAQSGGAGILKLTTPDLFHGNTLVLEIPRVAMLQAILQVIEQVDRLPQTDELVINEQGE